MRWLTSVLVGALVAGGLGTASVAPAAAAAPQLTLKKDAPAGVLLGDPIPYTLTVTNPGDAPLYNVSFSDILPTGFEYTGTTEPASAGEPTITQDGGRSVLVWNNVTDLQANSSFTLRFKAVPNPVPTTIAPTDTNDAWAAGQTDARVVPEFGPDGKPLDAAGQLQQSGTATTKRLPYVIEKKSSNSPEGELLRGELLRGVHDQRALYTLTVRNNKAVATNAITVTDYLPAGLEFLGCGDIDNSAPGYLEYPTADRLGVPKFFGNNPCPTPQPLSVETVEDPAVPGQGQLSGVYTKVTWDAGDFAAGQDKEIQYVAGIPLFENTTDWGGPEPAITGEQGSNLDNNSGASTREGIPERALTNRVTSTGTFTGQGAPDPLIVTTDHTVTIEDIRMQKKANTDTFTPGEIVTFRFEIQASEYMSGSGFTITDTLPDGYCPLGAQNYANGDPLCAGGVTGPTVSVDGGNAQGFDYDSVTWNAPAAPNTYSVVLKPNATLPSNGTMTVTLPARMLPKYRATGDPTVAGDSFTDTVALRATTTPIPGVDGDPEPVEDASKYTQSTPQPKISKKMKPRAAPPTFPGGMDCRPGPGQDPQYQNDADIPAADKRFRKGDRVCFLLRVDFPKSIDTKGVVVTDFPPVNTAFELSSFTPTNSNTVQITPPNPDLSQSPMVLTLGDNGFVAKGGVFEAVIAVTVLRPATGTEPKITGNLMKMRTVNTAGEAQSYRDSADWTWRSSRAWWKPRHPARPTRRAQTTNPWSRARSPPSGSMWPTTRATCLGPTTACAACRCGTGCHRESTARPSTSTSTSSPGRPPSPI